MLNLDLRVLTRNTSAVQTVQALGSFVMDAIDVEFDKRTGI